VSEKNSEASEGVIKSSEASEKNSEASEGVKRTVKRVKE
jgi:hypothetical protein